jgi:hypothetical protein
MLLLKELTGVDVIGSRGELNSQVFGFKMSDPLVRELIDDYYAMADMGTPFLASFPEEYVLGALLNKPKYNALRNSFRTDHGYLNYFYNRQH